MYCPGAVKNHTFVDENKRAGLLSGRAFFLDGLHFEPDEFETIHTTQRLAAGKIGELEFAL